MSIEWGFVEGCSDEFDPHNEGGRTLLHCLKKKLNI